MTGPKSLEEFLWGPVSHLKQVKASLDLGFASNIVISNLFVMANFSKLDLQIHIKGIEGKSFRGFFENQSSGLIRAFPENCQLFAKDAQKASSSGNSIIPPLYPSNMRMRTWRKIPDT